MASSSAARQRAARPGRSSARPGSSGPPAQAADPLLQAYPWHRQKQQHHGGYQRFTQGVARRDLEMFPTFPSQADQPG
eukprot:5242302-Pyramimonas_sp.AAC.1